MGLQEILSSPLFSSDITLFTGIFSNSEIFYARILFTVSTATTAAVTATTITTTTTDIAENRAEKIDQQIRYFHRNYIHYHYNNNWQNINTNNKNNSNNYKTNNCITCKFSIIKTHHKFNKINSFNITATDKYSCCYQYQSYCINKDGNINISINNQTEKFHNNFPKYRGNKKKKFTVIFCPFGNNFIQLFMTFPTRFLILTFVLLVEALLTNMAARTFKDPYDYVLIDSGGPDSYLISSEVDSLFLNNDSINSAAVSLAARAGSLSVASAVAAGKSFFMNGTSLYEDNNGNGSLLFLNNESFSTNTTISANSTEEDIGGVIIMAATSIILGLMILITVIGNVFVIAAIILERNLQNVANYLVASLAVADLFVACLVMPLGAVYEISQGWILGPELCDIWTSCDVLCCTASILHLVAIATDRYWAVTNVDYIHSRTRKRVFTMIFLVWFAAVIVSLAPQFGWKDPEYLERIEQQKCMVSQDVAYQVFATCCTFYVPLLVILVLYWKIYQTARKRIHRRRPRPIDITANNNQPVPQKKKTRLKIRIASKFSSQGKSAASSLGLVEGNSTNTVNTVEDTEYSSNVDSKKGIEVTAFTNVEEAATSSTSQISTVSHLVSSTNQPNNENANSHQINQIPKIPQQQQLLKQQEQKILSTQGLDQIPTPTLQPSSMTLSPNVITSSGTGTLSSAPQTMEAITATNNTISTISSSAQQQHQQTSNQVTPIPQSKQAHFTTGGNGSGAAAGGGGGNISSIANPHSQVSKRKETLEAKRERKAAKTLAIITGAFVVCWLPFFLMALLLPLCGDSCHINDTVASLFLWLGYFNSTLNPVIYTIFSPEFRQAFKRILFGGHRPSHYRSGKI